jgi:hypothetical protein
MFDERVDQKVAKMTNLVVRHLGERYSEEDIKDVIHSTKYGQYSEAVSNIYALLFLQRINVNFPDRMILSRLQTLLNMKNEISELQAYLTQQRPDKPESLKRLA